MKLHVFLSTVVFTLSLSSSAQKNALYLIVTKDHLFQSARNERDETIIAAEYHYFGELMEKQEIEKWVMVGMPKGIHVSDDSSCAAQVAHTAIDRKRKLLYHSLLFENGPDDVHVDLYSFVNVKSEEVGYVRPDGVVSIPDDYDFLTANREWVYDRAHWC
ncbi:MAG: hypothetical protein ACTJHT_07880 [Sphingobacterium sp.]|uniref:hypothetical protein n=1 Tax=Sphingobacterium sp. JB170 TaxID=1434842 RepID=UPI00097F3625|nr:hypothetical protein [Sphingobacterium sp. JB170]SJN40481.1 hypothetical protein FM107_10660 [Sphingobacterium sp. JB170]